MKKVCYVIALMCLVVGLNNSADAQENNSGYNPNSVYPVHESDIMFKKTVWRRMDLNEKVNRPFFSSGNEISRIIVDAVRAGLLTAYENDSLKTIMTKEKFLQNLVDPRTMPMDDGFGLEDDGWGAPKDKAAAGPSGPFPFLNRQISVLEIQEDLIFDKKRSRMIYDIQSITLVIPAKEFDTGIMRQVASFKYKDLVALFRNMPNEAIWFNRQNTAQHKNMADAFTLRLFNARITRVSNPDNSYITDIYSKNEKEGLMASQWIETQLMEFEHELWEY
jgi:gliding motility associated protien GldN